MILEKVIRPLEVLNENKVQLYSRQTEIRIFRMTYREFAYRRR